MEANKDFRDWQADYAARRIGTFPVDADKKPMVRHYGRFGLASSGRIAHRFAGAPAIGFMCGQRSGVTVLDVDTNDERVLADAVDRHGRTPIIARSGSGNFQAWYRHAGERRLIRPRRDVPIDILGAGFVVAPPSRVARGSYQFIQGSLDDLESLPTLNDAPAIAPEMQGMRQGDGRNNRLFKLGLRAVKGCDDFDQLLDWCRTQNDFCAEPMSDKEVMTVGQNIWKYESNGLNRVGRFGGNRQARRRARRFMPAGVSARPQSPRRHLHGRQRPRRKVRLVASTIGRSKAPTNPGRLPHDDTAGRTAHACALSLGKAGLRAGEQGVSKG